MVRPDHEQRVRWNLRKGVKPSVLVKSPVGDDPVNGRIPQNQGPDGLQGNDASGRI